jgi:hypothetical protein
MRILGVLTCACAAACGNAATGPDPAAPPPSFPVSISILNYAPVPVYITWHDGHGMTGTDTVPADTVPPASDIQNKGGVTRCERFTAHADTASWSLLLYAPSQLANDSVGPDSTVYATGSFNPAVPTSWGMDVAWFKPPPVSQYVVQLIIDPLQVC